MTMATIKSYTDIEQSKKLAEILPLESADMIWVLANPDLPMIKAIAYEDSEKSKYYEILPAWSLASLLGVLPEGYSFVLTKSFNGEDYYCKLDGEPIEAMADNPIDACYELILKLKELKLL